MTSNETSAKATTSARRMTGGSSVLLSGSGVLVAASWEGNVRWAGHANRLSRYGKHGWKAATSGDETASNQYNPQGRQKFHRAVVTRDVLDSARCI
jgi:hypothetical protein